MFSGGRLTPEPAQNLAVVTCMDCRFDPLSCFGLSPGDVHIIRNAGARVTDDVIRSLIVSTVQLGVDRIAVVHHTDCATQSLTVSQMTDAVLAATGVDPAGIDFMFRSDGPQTLLSDIRSITRCPFLPKGTEVAGFIFEVETGRVRQTTEVFTVG